MKAIKRWFTMILLAAVAILATACSVTVKYADVQVASITVDGISKTEYVACDDLDISGATLLVTYDNDEHESLTLTKDMLDPTSYDMNLPGRQNVVVTYGGKSTSFTINVSEWKLIGVELSTTPYVTDYIVGENVNPRGAKIKCSYEGNKTKFFDVTTDMLEAYDKWTVGETTVKLTYSGTQMSFKVTFNEKTPVRIQLNYLDESNNFVFVGKGDEYDVTGMRVRVFYDNDETPEFNVKEEIEEDVFISIDDSLEGAKDAVLMFYPKEYKEIYKYVYNGLELVTVGQKVSPGQSLASDRLVRTTEFGVETVVLDEVTSKSFGTVLGVSSNPDGSRTMTVGTTAEYELTEVTVKEGAIVYNNAPLGKRYGSTVYAQGGGVVERIENNVVYIKTAVTTTFKTNVNVKSFRSMDILSYPTPTKFKDTTITDMIEGDELNKTTGKVRVYYNDGSQEEFGMDNTAHISLVNDGSTSVNDVFRLTPGRQKVLVVYDGVMTYSTYFYVTMTEKYPTALRITEETNKINAQTFYFGDRISLSTMSYFVTYNNGDVGEAQPLTEDMVDEGYTLECLPSEDRKARESTISFRLPDRYENMIPEQSNGEPGTYEKPIFHYWVVPQPIQSIDFIQTPVKVYVAAKANLSYDGAKLNAYYRNNTVTTLDFANDTDYTVYQRTVPTWDAVDSYNFADEATTDGGKRVYVFTLEDDKAIFTDITAIIRKKNPGYEARVYYFDGYNVQGGNFATFNYFLIDSSYVVSGIKLATLKDASGNEYYKEVYTQFESWDLAGLQLNVSYQNGQSAMLSGDDLWDDMIYDSNTYKKGSNIPVKFTYLGATDDDSLTINVVDRVPTKIELIHRGTTEYTGEYLKRIDFTDFTFNVSYNSGPTETIAGTQFANIPIGETDSGWWYEMFYVRERTDGIYLTQTNQLMQEGTVIFRLHYSYPNAESEKGYDVISSPDPNDLAAELFAEGGDETAVFWTVNVWEKEVNAVAIYYEQNRTVTISGTTTMLNPTHKTIDPDTGEEVEYINEETNIVASWGGIPVLSEVASGWDLMLTEFVNGVIQDKILTVEYKDNLGATQYEYVVITPEMLSYDVNDKTVGYRRVTILYKNLKTTVMMYVWSADLTDVDVAITPLQNYIYTAINSEEDLDLGGGIIRLTFTKKTRKGAFAGYMTKYVDMSSEDLTYSGFVKGEYSKEGKEITINAIYKDYDAPELTASYVITVYDRQDVSFSYSNVIFFYGNAAPAAYTARQKIDEFSLPSRIALRYVETKNMLTLAQYAALTSEEKQGYAPVTMYDEDRKYAMTMFVPENTIRAENYIDPAADGFYVRYGTVLLISEEDCEDAFKDYLSVCVPTYNESVEGETFYACVDQTTVQTVLNRIAWCKSLTDLEKNALSEEDSVTYDLFERLSRRMMTFVNVITDKITEEEYEALTAEGKANYEYVDNEYYILMRVADDRPLARRYYETANYAFQNYTVIQKVIEVVIDTANENSRILRISTKTSGAGGNVSGNPYAIYYLTNPNYNVLADVKKKFETDHPEATYINALYLASPNESYFEIVVKFNDGYVETDESMDLVAELFYRVMYALYDEGFTENMHVVLTQVNFDYESGFTNSSFHYNRNDTDGMKSKIKQKWSKGVNVFGKSAVVTAVENGVTPSMVNRTTPYLITYTLTFGDTKTRNGILQLLSGCLRIGYAYDENGAVIGYKLEAGTLKHSSYTLDLSKCTVGVGETTVSVTTGE